MRLANARASDNEPLDEAAAPTPQSVQLPRREPLAMREDR